MYPSRQSLCGDVFHRSSGRIYQLSECKRFASRVHPHLRRMCHRMRKTEKVLAKCGQKMADKSTITDNKQKTFSWNEIT